MELDSWEKNGGIVTLMAGSILVKLVKRSVACANACDRAADDDHHARPTKMNKHRKRCSPMQPVENIITASFCPEIGTPRQFELGQLKRGDGILGAVMPLSGSLNRSLEIPDTLAQIKIKKMKP